MVKVVRAYAFEKVEKCSYYNLYIVALLFFKKKKVYSTTCILGSKSLVLPRSHTIVS
jgi:hypothetical protein